MRLLIAINITWHIVIYTLKLRSKLNINSPRHIPVKYQLYTRTATPRAAAKMPETVVAVVCGDSSGFSAFDKPRAGSPGADQSLNRHAEILFFEGDKGQAQLAHRAVQIGCFCADQIAEQTLRPGR